MRVLFTESAMIRQEIQEVFKFISVPENIPLFMPAVVRCQKANQAEISVGSKLLETRKALGKEVTAPVEVSRFEENKLFAIKSENGGIFGEYVYELLEDEDQTNLTLTAFVQAQGWKKILMPIFSSAMKKYDSGQVWRIKDFVEKGYLIAIFLFFSENICI